MTKHAFVPQMPAGLSRHGTRTIDVLDMHTAGEPVRIVTGGYPELDGRTILDKRRLAAERFDALRTVLMHEPRGHAGMYGVIPVKTSLPDANLACLFTHASGYSTMCGHATIAIGRWAVESGQVKHNGTDARFGLELPCGLVQVEAKIENGMVVATAFDSVPAFVDVRTLSIGVEGLGRVCCDVAFGGAYYAILPASRMGLSFDAGLPALLAAGARVFTAARAAYTPQHPTARDLSFLYGVILTDDARPDSSEPSANVCLFGAGQIDRSPTGSGVTARMALDVLSGDLPLGESRTILGPTGEGFTGTAVRRTRWHGRDAVVVRVEGRSFYSGATRFVIERNDPLRDGFLLLASESNT